MPAPTTAQPQCSQQQHPALSCSCFTSGALKATDALVLFSGNQSKRGASQAAVKEDQAAQAAGAGATDSIISAGEGGDCLKQVLQLSLSARYEQGSLISLWC